MSDVELVEFAVDRYKNLRSIRIEWSPKQVLFGANGVGKTNLLEAIALCFGSDATLWQLARRVTAPEAGVISAVVRATPMQLPPPPGSMPSLQAFAQLPEDDPSMRTILPHIRAARFWLSLNCGDSELSSWGDAMRTLLPEPIGEIVASAAARPLIRFHLESLDGLDEARDFDRGSDTTSGSYPLLDRIAFRRHFRRTLVLEGPPPPALVEVASELPEAFAPFRRWLDQEDAARGRFVDLMVLPDDDWAPVNAVWLAAERSAPEAFVDLSHAFEKAAPVTEMLQAQLNRLRFDPDSSDEAEVAARERRIASAAAFWLVAQAAEAASATLEGVFPKLSVSAEDDHISCLVVADSVARSEAFISDTYLFDRLSSGERTWLDFGFAHGAAAIERGAARAAWVAMGIEGVADEGILDAAVDLEEVVGEWDSGPSGSEEATAYFERFLGTPLEVFAGPFAAKDPNAHVTAMYASGLEPVLRAAFTPVREIHLYDEPERHLHPAAQRRAARCFDQPTPQDVVLATHSHLFLGTSGWRHHHIDRTPEGTISTPFDPADLDTNLAITRQLGLGRGELLSRFRYLLVVEGLIDEIVLSGLFGDLFAEAGILVLPMHGVDEVLSLVELELFGRLVDIGAGVLVDHARTKPHGQGHDRTKEEAALRDLNRRLSQRGRSMDNFGLRHVDVLAYLHEDAMRSALPAFPGWETFDTQRSRTHTNFKDALFEATGDHFGRKRVREIVADMHHRDLPGRDDLPSVVADIVAAAQRS